MKVLKYAIASAGLFLVVAVGFFIFSVTQLPDPVAVKQILNAEEPKTEVQSEIETEVADLSQKEEAKTGNAVESTTTTTTTRNSSSSKDIANLMKEDARDIRICDNLGKMSGEKPSLDTLSKALSGKNRNDPMVESMRIPMKNIFQSTPVKELFADIEEVDTENLQPEEKANLLSKIGFYTMAANRVREIYSQKAEYEEFADRAYGLYIVAKIAQRKPELALDKNVLDFCNQLQVSIGTKANSDIAEERKELLKLIEYAGLTPKELNFNPEIKTKFNIELSKTGLTFGLSHPGMESVN